MKEKLLKWYATGEKGLSSENMAATVLGLPSRLYHPCDPADLNRCIKLVDAVPEIKTKFPEIAKLSPQWKEVINNWEKLREMFISEVGFDWQNHKSAGKTYEFMKQLGL